jgi:UDP-glucose 4-epimerase
MNHKKVLITGAGGYIGSVTVYEFLKKGYEIIGVDSFLTGYEVPLKLLQKQFGEKKFRYYHIDLKGDLSSIFKKEKNIMAVIHFAASCLVNESMENPSKYFINNVCSAQNLIKSMLDNGINNIVFSSTCAVYGDAKYVPIDEKHPTEPENPYGESKLIVEKTLRWYGSQCGLKYVILRYFNVCGASDDGFVGDSKKPSVLLVQNAVRGALGIEPFQLTCPKVNTKDGTPIRDYVNVVDLALAHLKALEYLNSGKESTVINLGTGKGNSVLEIVKAVQKKTKVEFSFNQGKPRLGESKELLANISKARRLLHWKPERTIAKTIDSLLLWYKAHPHGWN